MSKQGGGKDPGKKHSNALALLVSSPVILALASVRRNEDANSLVDMPDPLSLRQDIVWAEHRLIDRFPHDQPVELSSGDHCVADRQQAAIRPPLYVECQTRDRPPRTGRVLRH